MSNEQSGFAEPIKEGLPDEELERLLDEEAKSKMKIKCPRCDRILKEFEPTESERGLFDDDELQRGESFHWKPCELCEARLAESHRRRH